MRIGDLYKKKLETSLFIKYVEMLSFCKVSIHIYRNCILLFSLVIFVTFFSLIMKKMLFKIS